MLYPRGPQGPRDLLAQPALRELQGRWDLLAQPVPRGLQGSWDLLTEPHSAFEHFISASDNSRIDEPVRVGTGPVQDRDRATI